jgi:hypothetical protein
MVRDYQWMKPKPEVEQAMFDGYLRLEKTPLFKLADHYYVAWANYLYGIKHKSKTSLEFAQKRLAKARAALKAAGHPVTKEYKELERSIATELKKR